jgi:hypothetical protein
MTKPDLTDDTILVASGDQVSSDLGNETVLLQLRTKTYYGLPGVAGQVWEQLQEPVSVADLRQGLLDRYDVEPERCEKELADLLHQMLDAKLIKQAE